MDQRIVDLYDAYTHGALERRVFLDRLAQVAGGAAAAAALLPLLQNDYALAETVPPSDARLAVGMVDFGEPATKGYLARPAGGGKHPAVVVIHENRGLNAHIQDVARRVALEGYLALAPDLLTGAGGTPADEDQARELIGALDPAATLARLVAAVDWLAKHPQSTGKVGTVGFCWGGAMANQLAAAGARPLAAAVAYYGRQLPASDVPRVSAALLLHYAEHDERVNEGIPAYEAALKANGKPYELYRYPGTQHAFNNDTNTARYDAAAARLAWERTLAFLKRHLA